MTDHFDIWINSMSDDEYEDWLEDEATDAQEKKALNIRTPVSQEVAEEIVEGQESQKVEEVYDTREGVKTPATPVSKIVVVTDNRDLPPVRVTKDIIIPPTGRAPIITPPRIETAKELQQVSTTIKQPTLRQRVSSAISGFFALFRRKKNK